MDINLDKEQGYTKLSSESLSSSSKIISRRIGSFEGGKPGASSQIYQIISFLVYIKSIVFEGPL
jgi:hypothetical protein